MSDNSHMYHDFSILTDHDIYLFKEGRHFKLQEKLGSHLVRHKDMDGVYFAVWAPNANYVSVVGDFNHWDRGAHQLKVREDGSGIWEGFIPGLGKGTIYKYHIGSHNMGYSADKGDPYARLWEVPPKTASVIWDNEYNWNDEHWMQTRAEHNKLDAPVSIYEVHLGSWKRATGDEYHSMGYLELAEHLPKYVKEMGFTHVEFLPVMEHPFFGSWGYQTLGYFAPSSRQGTPQEFMALVDALHQEGIGVILDWVPSHFPGDGHGLSYFDGTHLYEHEDPRQGYHPDWSSYIFNHGRWEVQNFLISSALYWLEVFHIDGLRVDAVASMLYLDYSRKDGEWIPNKYGGKENIEAIEFIRSMNATLYERHPDIMMIAEESTAWPMVSRPAYVGGLGFGMKWNMGWMHDTLSFFSQDSVFRKYHINQITFSIWYAFSENFMLPLSHDEVVHGKGSIYGRMPGDHWQKMANLRLLYGYMFTHPGKKLLFMGAEFGQRGEWQHDFEPEWFLLEEDETHQKLKKYVADINGLYKNEPALHDLDFDYRGFEWIDFHDADASIISYLRIGADPEETLLMCFNFTPVPRDGYTLGVPKGGQWQEVLNSDAEIYGGTGWGNFGGVEAVEKETHGRPFSLSLTVPPLGMVILRAPKG